MSPGFPFAALRRPPGEPERAGVVAMVRGLLGWSVTMSRWPRASRVPDGTPFVSLYVGGALRGCYGADQGSPAERLARAFVLASHDARFGGLRAQDRVRAAAQIAYVSRVRRVEAGRLERELEIARDGLGLVDSAGRCVVLLPGVARDRRLDVDGFVKTMAHKSGLPRADWGGAGVFLFRTVEIPVRPGPRRAARRSSQRPALDAAAAHLARLVDESGQVAFGVDPRTGARAPTGTMHHGRIAVALRALAGHGGHAAAVARARARLAQDVASGLRGAAVDAWPGRPDVVAGTLALVAMGGVAVERELAQWVAAHAAVVAASPWHAAQAVAALGPDAPAPLWAACVRDLGVHPWAPWTAIAARSRGDLAVLGRCAPALAASIRPRAPHAGGCSARPVPETALTAVVVEALAGLPAARAPVRLARAFLRAWQVPDDPPACFSADDARGAFPASPIADTLRADITGHAMLALA